MILAITVEDFFIWGISHVHRQKSRELATHHSYIMRICIYILKIKGMIPSVKMRVMALSASDLLSMMGFSNASHPLKTIAKGYYKQHCNWDWKNHYDR